MFQPERKLKPPPPDAPTLKLHPKWRPGTGSKKSWRLRGWFRALPGKWICLLAGGSVFDRLEADLAKAMLSLPATKGFEVGSGFQGTYLKGSEHNDPFEIVDGRVRAPQNLSGGVQGGISNGEELYFRVGFKPTATVLQVQKTVDTTGQETELMGRGRHDPLYSPGGSIVEAMAALVLLDHRMLHSAQCGSFSFA